MDQQLSRQQKFWLEKIQACEQSGCTMKEYADVHGLSLKKLYDWKSRLSRRGLLPDRSAQRVTFDRVVVSSAEEIPCRVIFPNGVVLETAVPTTNEKWRGLLQAAWSLS